MWRGQAAKRNFCFLLLTTLSPLYQQKKNLDTYALQWTALEESNCGSDSSELKYPVSMQTKSRVPSQAKVSKSAYFLKTSHKLQS